MRAIVGGIALLAAVASLGACGTSTCNANICAGCCNTAGVCQPGNLSAACGSAGALCDVCGSAQTCDSARCTSGSGGGTGGSGGSGGGGGTLNYKRVFVTNATYNGNLQSAGGAASGLAGGDALCNTAATAAALGGTWKAWLSDGTSRAVDRITGNGPWKKLDSGRTIVFNNKANLSTLPLVPIDYNENGVTVVTPGIAEGVWTGTDTGGGSANYHCGGWAGTGVLGAYGNAGSTTDWTRGASTSGLSCSTSLHLYCFEL